MTRLIKRLSLFVFVFLMTGLLLAACGGGETTSTVEDEPATTATDSDSESQPTPTEAPAPTEEPAPEPTAEPTPEPTEEPTAVPDLAADFVAFSSPIGGFNVKHPQGWSSQDLFGFVVLASNEALLEADAFEADDAGVIIMSDTAEAMGLDVTDLETALAQGSEQMDLGESEILEGPDLVMINGQEGARMVINTNEADMALTAVVYIATAEERVVILAGLSNPDSFADHVSSFDAIAQTLVITEPTEDSAFNITPPSGDIEGFLIFGDVVSGIIDESGSSSWEIMADAGEMVDIVVTPKDEELDVMVDVLTSDGNSILPTGQVDNSFGIEEILGLEITESGTFYIVVSGFDASDTGDYEIAFNEAGATSTSEDGAGSDTMAMAAGDIAYGSTIDGAINADNQSPSFTFSGSEGDIVNIMVNPDDEFDIVLDVLNPDGDSILLAGSDNSFGREIVMLELESAGEYSIVVTPFDEGSSGSFEISLGGPDGSVIFADDSIEAVTEEHFFPFNALEGEIVNIIVMPQGEFDVVVTLFNDDTDEELFTIDRSFGMEGLGFVIPEDGNYYYSITGFVADDDNSEGGENLGDYDVMLFGTDLVISETTIGDTIRGVFSTEDGIIELFYMANADEPVTLTLAVAEDVDGVIEIMDLDNNILTSADEDVAGGSETLTYTAVEEGLVIIRVSEFFGGSGSFVLNVEG